MREMRWDISLFACANWRCGTYRHRCHRCPCSRVDTDYSWRRCRGCPPGRETCQCSWCPPYTDCPHTRQSPRRTPHLTMTMIMVFSPKIFHNYTTSNVLLTSTFQPPSAAFFGNWMSSGHCPWWADYPTPSSEQWPLNIEFLTKAADGGRNVQVSRTLLVV